MACGGPRHVSKRSINLGLHSGPGGINAVAARGARRDLRRFAATCDPNRNLGYHGCPDQRSGIPSPMRASIEPESELQRRCTSLGVPLTAQRRVVMEVLAERHDHPTVEQIHAAVELRLPGVSRATVYRNLELLMRLGLVRQLAHLGSAARYDPNLEPHHHFHCDRCGSVHDLAPERVRGSEHLGFVLGTDGHAGQDISVTVRGTCCACKG